MTDPDCLFCRIVADDLHSERLHEDEHVIAFHDIAPQAPLHVLIIPRAHIRSAAELDEDDAELIGRLVGVATRLATAEGLDDRGYRLVTNIGEDGGQSVDHLHLHLLGGRPMAWPPG